jgi:hypothetical protein
MPGNLTDGQAGRQAGRQAGGHADKQKTDDCKSDIKAHADRGGIVGQMEAR